MEISTLITNLKDKDKVENVVFILEQKLLFNHVLKHVEVRVVENVYEIEIVEVLNILVNEVKMVVATMNEDELKNDLEKLIYNFF